MFVHMQEHDVATDRTCDCPMSFIDMQEFDRAVPCAIDHFELQLMPEGIKHVTACQGHEAEGDMIRQIAQALHAANVV
ncbi:hypothetical protein GCM10011363_45990 [Marivita lacus]|uniref:Uncharacterized protein n=1 Tax=Marivita lacus TaxID=1323742 RepID=A0ABQ1LJN3_9RHOB|nr:hypothetical protein GCM10011363_45990 [Marivita lacus]